MGIAVNCKQPLAGFACPGREAVEMAERLVDEQAGVSIFAFGVGRGVEKTELEKIINVCGPGAAETRYMALCTSDDAPW